MPKPSEFDAPLGTDPEDPLPVEGEANLAPDQLAHLRIAFAITRLAAAHHKDAKEWRAAFNNMADNVRGLLKTYHERLSSTEARVSILERNSRERAEGAGRPKGSKNKKAKR